MLLFDDEVVEHLLHVCHHGILFKSESDVHTDQSVIEVGALEQHIIKRYIVALSARLKDYPDLSQLLRMVNAKAREIPAFLTSTNGRSMFCMTLAKHFLHELHIMIFHLCVLFQCPTEGHQTLDHLTSVVWQALPSGTKREWSHPIIGVIFVEFSVHDIQKCLVFCRKGQVIIIYCLLEDEFAYIIFSLYLFTEAAGVCKPLPDMNFVLTGSEKTGSPTFKYACLERVHSGFMSSCEAYVPYDHPP